MGIIEGLAARFNLAGDRKFNQNENRVPVGNPEAYVPGISAEDAYKLQLVKQAQDANYAKSAADRFNASKEYISAKQAIDNAPIQYRREENPDEGGYTFSEYKNLNPADLAAVRKYQQNIDPGLAAKWMADRESFK